MSEQIEHKDPQDRFNAYIKGRLEDHRTPVDPTCWDAVAGHLKRRRWIRFGQIGLGVAVAAALLTGLLWLPVSPVMEEIPEEVIVQEIQPSVEHDPVEKKVEELPVEKPVIAHVQSYRPRTISISVSTDDEMDVTEEDPIEEIIPVEQPEDTEVEATEKKEQTSVRGRNTATPQEPVQRKSVRVKEKPVRRKDKGQWLMAAAFGTGGGDASNILNIGNGSQDYANSNDPQHNWEGGLISQPPAFDEGGFWKDQDYSDITHAVPVSVGITIRRDLNRSFALETGLYYTYLSSNLKRQQIYHRNDRLDLHYLGIPVNLVGYLVKQPRWNLYLSGGVMIEKGLRAVFTEKGFYSNQIVSTTNRTSISGLQFSLNGSLGVSYRIVDHWSLYAEPKIYYYFDTDQPISVRTEYPFGFGLNAGVRYHFK